MGSVANVKQQSCRSPFPRGARRGFTLVELLVVIAIIIVLAGLLLAALGPIRRHWQNRECRMLLVTLGTVLDSYHNDFHQYPRSNSPDDGVVGNENLVKALQTEEFNGPYIGGASVPMRGSDAGNRVVVDPWGQPLRYFEGRDYGRQKPNRDSYRLYSIGIDGVEDPYTPESDDVVNWRKEAPEAE
jgi:prepilin-type N-terminal cleavage/methylation domain-containing protein